MLTMQRAAGMPAVPLSNWTQLLRPATQASLLHRGIHRRRPSPAISQMPDSQSQRSRHVSQSPRSLRSEDVSPRPTAASAPPSATPKDAFNSIRCRFILLLVILFANDSSISIRPLSRTDVASAQFAEGSNRTDSVTNATRTKIVVFPIRR